MAGSEILATKEAAYQEAKKAYEAAKMAEVAAWEAAEVVEREAAKTTNAADEEGLRMWRLTTAAWDVMSAAAAEVKNAAKGD